jgi:hypothetical protein
MVTIERLVYVYQDLDKIHKIIIINKIKIQTTEQVQIENNVVILDYVEIISILLVIISVNNIEVDG